MCAKVKGRGKGAKGVEGSAGVGAVCGVVAGGGEINVPKSWSLTVSNFQRQVGMVVEMVEEWCVPVPVLPHCPPSPISWD